VNLPDIRDLVIIIFGSLGIIVLILGTILGIWFYRRTRPILDNIEATSINLRNVVDTVKEKFVDPAAQFMAMIMGFKQIIEVIKQFFKKRQGGSDE
jgi:hypothetical protein